MSRLIAAALDLSCAPSSWDRYEEPVKFVAGIVILVLLVFAS